VTITLVDVKAARTTVCVRSLDPMLTRTVTACRRRAWYTTRRIFCLSTYGLSRGLPWGVRRRPSPRIGLAGNAEHVSRVVSTSMSQLAFRPNCIAGGGRDLQDQLVSK